MKFSKEIEAFIKDFLSEIEENNAAVFAGAGLSAASGHVDWKGLLHEFADELGLDIQKETDLLSLIQYHLNKNANNRHLLNQKITKEFHHGKRPNENHKILARLPVSLYWTTNYDKLIETALQEAGKIVDIKYTTPHLARTIPGRDVTIYKMHGDVDHPENTILSKDEYEKYYHTHGPYINALSGDLVSKTFLFIGFSFTDPNLDYVLSRIRVAYQNNQRHHYCFFREVQKTTGEDEKEYEYRRLKQALAIQDLLRFNIKVLMVQEYGEINAVLKEIETRYKQKTIYVSGSAAEYGTWKPEIAELFISKLSKGLIKNGYKIVSGFGLGVGSSVISGVLEEIYMNRKEKLKDQLLLRPFPQGEIGKLRWEEYRKDMISYAGIAIFLFGNKLVDGKLELADGVRKEFEIAAKSGALVLPIGATGYVSKELWGEVHEQYESYFPGKVNLQLFEQLGLEDLTPDDIVKHVIQFLNQLNK
jgi:hypothetical protein